MKIEPYMMTYLQTRYCSIEKVKMCIVRVCYWGFASRKAYPPTFVYSFYKMRLKSCKTIKKVGGLQKLIYLKIISQL